MSHRRKIFVARKDKIVNSMNTYKLPLLKIKTTLNSLSGSSEVVMYGERVFNMYRLVLDYKYKDLLKENDLVYVDVDPKDDNEYCLKADYRIDSIRPQNLKIIVYLDKKEGKKK